MPPLTITKITPHKKTKKHVLEVSTHPSPRWRDVLFFFQKNDDSKVLKMFLFEVSGVPNSPAAIWISLTKVPLELRGKCWWPTLEDSNGETSSDFFWHRCHRSRNKKRKLVWSSAFESFMRPCDANSDPPVPPVCSKKEGLNSMTGKLVVHVWARKMTSWSLTCWDKILWIKSQNKRRHNIGYCMTLCWWKKLSIYFVLRQNLRSFPWSCPSTVQFTHCWYSFKDRISEACLIMKDCYHC